MRILLLGPLPPPVGGMATVVENLARALDGKVEIRVLNNVKTTAADRALWRGVAAQLRLLLRLAALCIGWGPHVVHIHTCSWLTFWRNGADVLLARLLGRRVLLHVHGAEFHKFLASLGPSQALLARWILRRSHRVVVLGDRWRSLLEQWVGAARVVVVPNGVPTREPVEIGRADAFTVVCLANYERRKGQADLLHALSRLAPDKAVRLLLLGAETEPGQRAALIALADELGIADQVEIPGPVMGEEKEAWLRRSDCFCLPSYDEGLPMSMLEAMALGLPVVVTRVGSISEALEDSWSGLLFEPGDIQALAEHLGALADDRELARQIGRAGHARLAQGFSLERSVELLLEIYRRISGTPLGGESIGGV